MNQPTLGEFIQRQAADQNISLNEIERRAERKGFKITQSYISKIINGTVQSPTVDKLKALAAGLSCSLEELVAAASGEKPKMEKINNAIANALFYKYPQLDKTDQSELSHSMQMLLNEVEKRLEKRNKNK